MWQDDFIEYLNQQFAELKAKNPRYSLRAFSAKVGLSPGALYATLLKKKSWNISRPRALEILEKLPGETVRRTRLLVKMGEKVPYAQKNLSLRDEEILEDWAVHPVLFSFELPTPFNEPPQIAKRLGLSEKRVNEIIADLLARGLLTRDAAGVVHRPEEIVRTGDGPSSSVIRRHHVAHLNLAKAAIEAVPTERRDFTTVTFAGSEQHLSTVREKIRQLLEETPILMDEGGENTHVYRMSVQLFPFDLGPADPERNQQ